MLSFGPRSASWEAQPATSSGRRARPAAPSRLPRRASACASRSPARACRVRGTRRRRARLGLPLWLFWLVAAACWAWPRPWSPRRVRTRRSLQRERLANRLIDHSPQLVCVLDPNGALRHMNGTGRQWLRVTHPEIAGRRLDEIAALGIDAAQAARCRP